MKKLGFVILFLLVLSCNSLTPSEEKISTDLMIEHFSSEKFIKEKFEDFYDLTMLQKKYSKFNEGIEKRIQGLTMDSEIHLELNSTSQIKNIRVLQEVKQVSDSIQKVKVLFDVITNNQIKKDSIIAYILKKKIVLDSNEVFSTKIKFSHK